MKHIGIVGISAEGASLCYRTICSEAAKLLGMYKHPEIVLHNYSFHEILEAQNKGWPELANLLLNSIAKLHKCGVDFVIVPANSVHYCFKELREKSPIPVLSIVEIAAQECKDRKYKKVGLLGTSVTMEKGLYEEPLRKNGIELIIPGENDRKGINSIIFNEIVPDNITDKTVKKTIGIIKRLKTNSCDAVILGCTEIPLIINQDNSPLPFIDTTRLLARKALEYSLADL